MAEVPDVEQNWQRCSCPGCPSKPDDGTLLYCSRGLSPMRVRTVGCICVNCPVYRSYKLSDGYFCAVPEGQWDRLRRSLGGDDESGPPADS